MDKRKDIEDDKEASLFLPTIEPENWEGLDSVEIDEEAQVLENGDLRYENEMRRSRSTKTTTTPTRKATRRCPTMTRKR